MGLVLTLLGMLLMLVAVLCWVVVMVHAFSRSVGTGFMVLCIPVYNFVYGFTQFEHRLKGLILAGWLGGLVLGVVLRALGIALGAS